MFLFSHGFHLLPASHRVLLLPELQRMELQPIGNALVHILIRRQQLLCLRRVALRSHWRQTHDVSLVVHLHAEDALQRLQARSVVARLVALPFIKLRASEDLTRDALFILRLVLPPLVRTGHQRLRLALELAEERIKGALTDTDEVRLHKSLVDELRATGVSCDDAIAQAKKYGTDTATWESRLAGMR